MCRMVGGTPRIIENTIIEKIDSSAALHYSKLDTTYKKYRIQFLISFLFVDVTQLVCGRLRHSFLFLDK